MEPWGRLESLVELANLGLQGFLELLEQKETWEDLVTRVV